jgi:hypothetical protein
LPRSKVVAMAKEKGKRGAEMSYIDREAAKTAIMNYISEQTVSKYATSAECKAAKSGAEGAFNEIDYIPDADVVEVVRCKDCKHCEMPICPITGIEVYFCRYGIKPMEVKDNFYCGHGERKDGNG